MFSHGSWLPFVLCCFFFFNDTATTEIHTLSLHDALPISPVVLLPATAGCVLLGVLVAELWLQGQVHGSPLGLPPESSLPRGRRNALARLDIAGLKRQSASNATIGGAVLAGDLRPARLDPARPTPPPRPVRFPPSRPLGVIPRRDLLGLRRARW